MTTWRHFNPKPVKAWNVDALANSTPDAVRPRRDRAEIASILLACEALGRPKSLGGYPEPTPGDFALLDGRWCEIMGMERGWRSRRPRYELQDVAEPDMPRHRVAWSEIQRVARITPDPAARSRSTAAPPE